MKAISRVCLAVLIGLVLLSVVLTHTLVSAQPSIDSSWDAPDVIPGRVLVEYKPARGAQLLADTTGVGIDGLALAPIDQSARQAFSAAVRAQEFKALLPNTFVGTFDPAQRDRVLGALASDPDIVYFEPDRIRVSSSEWGTSTPNDPALQSLWGMTRIGAPAVWAKQSATRASVRVAVMEGYRIAETHPDLADQSSPIGWHEGAVGSHATHVAGTIAATGNNGRDVAGVANVELVELNSGTSDSDFANRVTWAVNAGVSVVNMSFKWCGDDGISNGNDCNKCLNPDPSNTAQIAIQQASSDILFVASAGNDACNTDSNGRQQLPAGYAFVVGVSAISDTNDAFASFSNFGSYVDLTAPGVRVTSTITNDLIGAKSGTSMAAPHVAGSAAAVLALKSDYAVDSLERLLTLTAEDLGASGRDDQFGWGVVRVDRAVEAIADRYAERGQTVCQYPGPQGSGTLLYPHCSVTQAVTNAPAAGVVGLVRGQSFGEAITITKAITIISVGGIATVGSP